MAEVAIVADPAIELLFEVVFGKIKTTIEKAVIYKDTFMKISETLGLLSPLFKDIKASTMLLDRSQSVTVKFETLLKKGEQLVDEYPKIKKWKNFYRRPGYTTRLLEFDNSLNDLLRTLPVQILSEVLKIGVSLQDGNAAKTGDKNDADVVVPDQIEAVKDFWEDFTVGLETPLADLKVELRKDNRPVLVLTAPPGCGKTTLAQKLCHDPEIQEKFKNNIMFVRVSKTPDLSSIVQRLYEHHQREVPSLRDEEESSACLKRLLMEIGQSPMLLVLDDVWFGSESIINKFTLPIPEYKILVTSRSEFPGFGSPYVLERLSDEDATTLFCRYAIMEDGSSNNPSDDVVKKVVQHCKKVPLALELVGALLRGKSQEIWERKVEEWSEESSVLSFEDKLLACLKSSLDFLGEKDVKLKECFMDLASFPEDKRILATALIDTWTELHGLKESHAIANLFELHHWNMANVIITRRDAYEKDGYYSEHFVTQHDMLRELAIHQSKQEEPEEERKRLILELNGNNLPNWWNEPNEKTFNASLVSITTDGKFSSIWCNMRLPQAEVLILNFQAENYTLPDFLVTMSKLKVLIITNHGSYPTRLTNFELLSSLTNLKRIRFERIELPSLAKTSITLKNLQKLSLFMCKVAHTFDSVKVSEVFPSLEEINIDYCTDLLKLPTEFFDTVNEKLKKLSITHCHKLSELPEKIENLVSLELLRLRSCIGLETLPDSICKLFRLSFLDISDCFSIRYLPEDIGEMRGLTKLNMKDCSRLQELPPSVLDLEELTEVVCDEDLKELWETHFCDNAEMNLRSEDDKKVNLRLAKEDHHLRWL